MSVLADAIARSILAERPAVASAPTCFACGRSYSKAAPLADDSGPSRFCSVRCRDAYDAGLPPYDPQPHRTVASVPLTSWVTVAGPPGTVGRRPYARDLPVSGGGCLISCRSCRRDFVSKGLRCCSVECERAYREQEGIARTMAEVGAEFIGEKRRCEQCGKTIPRWENKARRFCSRSCQEKALRQSRDQKPGTRAKTAQKAPGNGHSGIPAGISSTAPDASVVTVPVDLVGGGSFSFGGSRLEPAVCRTIIAVETRTETAAGALPVPQAEEAAV